MPFSVLLLTAGSSKRQILGYGDKVSMQGSPDSGELALFFQLDTESRAVSRGLNMGEKKCCDGLVFYTHNSTRKKVICLVEMKRNDLVEAEKQIKATRDHLMQMLYKECSFCPEQLDDVVWAAYIYRRSSSPRQTEECRRKLEQDGGFGKGNVQIQGKADIGPFLRKLVGVKA